MHHRAPGRYCSAHVTGVYEGVGVLVVNWRSGESLVSVDGRRALFRRHVCMQAGWGGCIFLTRRPRESVRGRAGQHSPRDEAQLQPQPLPWIAVGAGAGCLTQMHCLFSWMGIEVLPGKHGTSPWRACMGVERRSAAVCLRSGRHVCIYDFEDLDALSLATCWLCSLVDMHAGDYYADYAGVDSRSRTPHLDGDAHFAPEGEAARVAEGAAALLGGAAFQVHDNGNVDLCHDTMEFKILALRARVIIRLTSATQKGTGIDIGNDR